MECVFLDKLLVPQQVNKFPAFYRTRDSSVIIMTRLWAGRSGVRFPVQTKDFLFSKTSKLALGPTHLNGYWWLFFRGGGGGVQQLGQG
jgi:hypothetical protein